MVIAQCPLEQPKSVRNTNLFHEEVFGRMNNAFPANHTAIIDPGPPAERRWTFEQLRSNVNGFAKALREEHGLKERDIVGSFMENRCELIIAILGTLAAGGTYTGANPQYTYEELGRQFGDANARFVITRADLLPVLEQTMRAYKLHLKAIFVCDAANGTLPVMPKVLGTPVHSLESLTSKQSASPPQVRISPNDIAFMPYSSGTTGLPKGVLLSHSSLTTCLYAVASIAYEPTPQDITANILPMFHIGGFFMCFSPMHKGTPTITLSQYSPQALAGLIEKYKITLLQAVPTILLSLVKHPSTETANFDSIKAVMFGASPAGAELLQLLKKRMKNMRALCQVYGMSESGLVTAMPVMDLDRVPLKSTGVPAAGCKIKIMSTDETPRELGVDQKGEIWIYSPMSIMTGYHNKPEETAKCLLPDGWLRSGDIGYLDAAGYLYITDRLKELIKYKGYQVAPAELEDVIIKHSAVLEVGVVGLPSADVNIGELATAFVVAKQGIPGTAQLENEICNHTAQSVAPYKQLRGGVHFVDELPKTPTGKVLRRILKENAMKGRAKL